MNPAFTPPLPGDGPVRRLVLIFGDQLDPGYADHLEIDRESDVFLMMEVRGEALTPPSHRQRTILFLAAMRQFAQRLHEAGYRVLYRPLEETADSFDEELGQVLGELEPESLLSIRPGDRRVLAMLERTAKTHALPLDLREDPHFLTTPQEFAAWAKGRKRLVLEHFYRHLRRREQILVDSDGQPEGDRWNFDRDNRKSLKGRSLDLEPPEAFPPDAITREAIELVERLLPDAPGRCEGFRWPVTPEQAEEALDDFVRHRLRHFGDFQDAMLRGEPWLYHSLLSASLNLKLLSPRRCLEAAVAAYEEGAAPLNAVEGFVRQILGWREFIRGVYWLEGPEYRDRNHLGEEGELPELYWTGRTDMECMRQSLEQVLSHGYGHHIQRLMITGNFALVAGVAPRRVADWYLGMYVDGVDWVTLPNVVGMLMFADGGVVATKPYAASGSYVHRMSDYCGSCRYDPKSRTGDDACPFSTFYWDFLRRHRDRLAGIPRMGLVLANLERLDEEELEAIAERAAELRRELGIDPDG